MITITNATILASSPAATNAAGKRTWGAATSLSVRCFLDAPTRKQRAELGAVIEDATAVAFIPSTAMNKPADGDKLNVQLDGEVAADYEVATATPRIKAGGLSHFECFLRAIR